MSDFNLFGKILGLYFNKPRKNEEANNLPAVTKESQEKQEEGFYERYVEKYVEKYLEEARKNIRLEYENKELVKVANSLNSDLNYWYNLYRETEENLKERLEKQRNVSQKEIETLLQIIKKLRTWMIDKGASLEELCIETSSDDEND